MLRDRSSIPLEGRGGSGRGQARLRARGSNRSRWGETPSSPDLKGMEASLGAMGIRDTVGSPESDPSRRSPGESGPAPIGIYWILDRARGTLAPPGRPRATRHAVAPSEGGLLHLKL